MAKKITKNIRINKHDVLKNEFHLTFQMRGSERTLTVIWSSKLVFMAPDAEGYLGIIGFGPSQIDDITVEVYEWAYKPRKVLGGLSYADTMESRFHVVERLEQERRAAAEVERMQAEAPMLDWAMSMTQDLCDELSKAEPAKSPASTTKRVIDHATMEAAFGERLRWEVISASPVPLPDETRHTAVHPVEEVAALQDEVKTGSPKLDGTKTFAVYPGWATDSMEAMEAAGLGEQPQAPSLKDPAFFPTIAEIELRKAKAEAIPAELAVKEALYRARRKIAKDATEKAVNVIHDHARRFLTRMSIREHDFLRSVIQDEIDKVVGAVL